MKNIDTSYMGIIACVVASTVIAAACYEPVLSDDDLSFDLGSIPYVMSFDESDEEVDAPGCTPASNYVHTPSATSIDRDRADSPIVHYFDEDNLLDPNQI